MAPLSRRVVQALHHGPQAGPALLTFDDTARVADKSYQQTENGYAVLGTGEAPDWLWSVSMVTICSAGQPSAIACCRSAYWLVADSVLVGTCRKSITAATRR
jgi:hypothetical protein